MKTSKTVVAVLFLFAAAMVSVADLALAWIAAGAKREGLRLRRGVNLLQKLDTSAVVLHDAHDMVWGIGDRPRGIGDFRVGAGQRCVLG